MNNKENHIDFLLTNPEFVRWVKNPDPDLDSFWQRWLKVHPEAFDEVKLARTIVLGMDFREGSVSAQRKESILNEIIKADHTGIGYERKELTKTISKSLWDRLGQWYKVAAILLVTLSFSFLFLLTDRKAQAPQVAHVSDAKWITKKTAFGEKLSFNLPDGTAVWLNSGSTLRFPELFDSFNRVVSLVGEAYFEVTPDSMRPFTVESGELITRVLGTNFNINLIHPELHQIALLTGKVSIQHKDTQESFDLTPGQQLSYSVATKSSRLVPFNEMDVLGWKNGVIRFERASFSEVIATLERWYGVEFKVEGVPKERWNLTGSYRNQTLELVLERMAFVEDFTYSIHKKTVNLKFN